MDHNKPDIDIEEVRRYLNGNMTGDEQAQFKSRLENDPAFAEEVNLNRVLLESIDLHFKSKLKERLQKGDEVFRITPPTKKRTLKQVLAMAASLSLIAVASYFLFYKNADPQQLYDQYHTTYYNVVDGNVRSGETEAVSRAFELYDQGDFQAAAHSFERIIKQDKDNMDYIFYQGLSLLEMGNADTAIASFMKVVSATDDSWTEPAKWYLGLAYLRAGRSKKAGQVFEEIVGEGGSYSERAKEILKKL